MFQQDLEAVGGSLTASALCGAVPILVLFALLGGLRMRAWLASLISLGIALVSAVALFGMPVDQGVLAGTLGAVFGFFPILWIVVNAVWLHNLTVVSGSFDVLRRSFARVSPDQRIQAIIIAFCFGALLEALAGFGTPVAISVVMLMTLGFQPMKAAVVALVANTAPVAFGALAIPIVTLAPIAAGANSDPRLTVDGIGAMVGRQTPLLAVIVPLILVVIVDGSRGARQCWLPALVSGAVFGLGQFAAANYFSVPLADIVAALLSAAALVLLVRVWEPAEVLTAEVAAAEEREAVGAGARGGPAEGGRPTGGGGAAADRVPDEDDVHDTRAEILRAYSPYLVVIAIFSLINIPAVLDLLAEEPFTYVFNWPGLHVAGPNGDALASTTFKLNWLPAAGTMLIVSGLISMVLLRVKPAVAARKYAETYRELWSAIVTVMAVLALAFVLNLSGQTASLGTWLAGTGGAFALLSPILGWLGVAVTGSDTSSNSLFGALQVQAAAKAGLDPLLMAAANSSGGVLGKMISPQNLAIAASAVGIAGQEGDIFRKVMKWSLLLVALMVVIVGLQATPVLGWMVPS